MAGRQEPPAGTVEEALERARRLLGADPALAERQARAILEAAPGDPRATLILCAARRQAGDPAAARALLADLAIAQPRSADTHHELGLALAAMGETGAALTALRAAVALRPEMPDAWRAIGDALTLAGDPAGADRAYARHVRSSVNEPALVEAAGALGEGRLAVAEHRLREHLRRHPTDVAAMRMLAETGMRLGRNADAEALLGRCLELAPSFMDARHGYAVALYRQQRAAEAIPQIERLLSQAPEDPAYRTLLAACLGLVGEYERAIGVYEGVLGEQGDQPRIWLAYGHALRTAGRRDEAIAAYQRALTLSPGLGEAYWSIANLKTARFSAVEAAQMEERLADPATGADDRLHLHYALGKALEDRGADAEAFEHYAAGAKLRLAETPYEAAETTAFTRRSKGFFTTRFFAERAGGGADDPAPIFIVGLPRSGSTLIEQILASHSAVEGTMELPEIGTMVALLQRGGSGASDPESYPAVLASLTEDERAALGEAFLARTRVHRKRGRAFFIDKMPQNFRHIGLIQLVLPKATIIDARRHPMAAGFSAFKQHFARGQAFSYDLTDVGLYYRDYLDLMAHFDAVLPGRVIRVIHEDLVADTEGQVRRLLDRCGLAFEPACLRFFETERAVRTASSEQVRRPIFREGLEHWRRFEPWLGPLREALGPALDTWRGETA